MAARPGAGKAYVRPDGATCDRRLVGGASALYLWGMSQDDKGQGQLTGMLLIAMPGMPDERFAKSVVYVCAHSEEGAMGLIVNRPAQNVTFEGIAEQLELELAPGAGDVPVHVGGPVESSRGFVLHSPDYVQDTTLVIDESFALTATLDVLRAIAAGGGPKRKVLALGYAGWGEGQLDREIQANGWLTAPASADLVFAADSATKWEMALRHIGVDPVLLSSTAGHA